MRLLQQHPRHRRLGINTIEDDAKRRTEDSQCKMVYDRVNRASRRQWRVDWERR